MENENDLRGALLLMAEEARKALVSGDFDKARVSIAGLATWAHEVATLDAVPILAPHPSAALLDVAAERRRQIEVEGWTPEHDDEHGAGAMSTAAACYALEGTSPDRSSTVSLERLWQWSGWATRWWKPKTRRQNLIRAAALLLAEIERLDRKG